MDNNKSSLAVKATNFQSIQFLNSKIDYKKSLFTNRDKYQNGFIKFGCNSNFYMFALQEDIDVFINRNGNEKSKISGFFTDEETINKVIEKNDRINLDKLAELLQISLRENKDDQRYYSKPYIISFKINWNKLLENNEIKMQLCNIDGRNDGRDSLEVAYGKVERNTICGIGGGNQYYIDKMSFIKGINFGIFEFDSKKSFINAKDIIRNGIDKNEYDDRIARNVELINEKLSTVKETNDPIEQAKILNKVDNAKINSQFNNVYDRNFIIPNYNYRAPFMYMYNKFKDIIKNSANLRTVKISIEDLNDYFSFIEFLFYKNLALKKEYNKNENNKLKKDDILDFNIDAIEKETKSDINIIDEFDDKIDFSKIKFESVENIKAEYEKYLPKEKYDKKTKINNVEKLREPLRR